MTIAFDCVDNDYGGLAVVVVTMKMLIMIVVVMVMITVVMELVVCGVDGDCDDR